MQQVRINAGYSEKCAANFQSTQYQISLEMDVSATGTKEIEDASARLFALCRKIVSSQKSVSVDSLLTTSAPVEQHSPISTTSAPAPVANLTANSVANLASPATLGNAPSASKPCSQKQVKYLLELAKKSGMAKSDIAALPSRFKKTSFQALTSTEASNLIEGFAKKAA